MMPGIFTTKPSTLFLAASALLCLCVFAASFQPELMQVGDVRGLAGSQDVTIAGCRRCVNMIKQKAGLAISESGAGSASLAAKIREECRKVLRNPHPLEHF